MSARSRPRGLRLRHVCPVRHQRRHLNHFISKADTAPPTTADAPPTGFTLAVKDNIATTSDPASPLPNHPTTCASPFLSAYHSPFEATVVTQLRARGARLVGKTNLDEFGMGSHSTHSVFGPVAQDPPTTTTTTSSTTTSAATTSETDTGTLLSAGGSSGGSAAAVAAGDADVALGTDTGGSVRLPAAYCGVVGFKPSYGMLSRFGVVPYANSLDTVGLLARDVRRIRALVVGEDGPAGDGNKTQSGGGLWAEHDPRDPTSLSAAARARCARGREGYDRSTTNPPGEVLRGLRLGLPLEYNIAELDPGIRAGWARAASALQERFGARVVPVSLPTTRHALAAYYVIAPAEASSNLAKYDGVRYGARDAGAGGASSDAAAGGVLYAGSRGAGFGDEVKRRILLGAYTLSAAAMDNYFLQAQRVRRLVRRDFDRVFALANPLHEPETFDLAELDERIAMEDKWGPEEVDFLLCPTAPTPPPGLDDVMRQTPVDAYVNDVFTVPASLAGLPAISIPMPGAETAGERGGAAGLQLIGQYWDDARLLAVAEAVLEGLRAAAAPAR